MIICQKKKKVNRVRALTLFFQVSQSFLNELRGSFELLSKFVSLFTHQTELHLKVSDAEEQQKQGKWVG